MRARNVPSQHTTSVAHAAPRRASRFHPPALKANHDFRSEMAAHNAAFEQVTQQVGVHCSERGELLRRLMAFYTRSTEVTARLAEKTMRSVYIERMTDLENENAELRRQVEMHLRREAEVAKRGTTPEEIIQNAFFGLSTGRQAKVLKLLFNDSGASLLLNRASPKPPSHRRYQCVLYATWTPHATVRAPRHVDTSPLPVRAPRHVRTSPLPRPRDYAPLVTPVATRPYETRLSVFSSHVTAV